MLLYNLVTLLRLYELLTIVTSLYSLYSARTENRNFCYCFIQHSVSYLRAHWKLFTYLIYKHLFPVNLTVYRSLTTKDQLIIMVIQLHFVCCVIKQQNFKNDDSEIG
jgi:cytochrome bd-type quinol oxidase subunit 2